MLYLHQYPSVWGLPSLSPFCIKVEAFLRLVNLPYQVIIENNPRKGPKGKMPVLRDDNKIIPDSTFIIDYLKNKYDLAIDDHLTNKQKAFSQTIKKMVEESLYFVILYSRWIDKDNNKIVNKAFSQFFPKMLGGVVLRLIRHSLKKQAYLQGIGRHSQDEIYQIGCEDIIALHHLLDEQRYLIDDKPHTIDIIAYAFLITILRSPYNPPLKSCLLKYGNLLDFCARMDVVCQWENRAHTSANSQKEPLLFM